VPSGDGLVLGDLERVGRPLERGSEQEPYQVGGTKSIASARTTVGVHYLGVRQRPTGLFREQEQVSPTLTAQTIVSITEERMYDDKKDCGCCGKRIKRRDCLPDGEWIDAFMLSEDGIHGVGVWLCIGCAGSNPHTTCGCCDRELAEALGLDEAYFDDKTEPRDAP